MELLWWLARYLHHARPDVLVTPDCKALFLSMDGVAGLMGGGIHDGRVAVPEIRRHRQRKLSPVPACDGDADAGERGRPTVDTGDAWPPERGEHADIHVGERPGASGGAYVNASGSAAGRKRAGCC